MISSLSTSFATITRYKHGRRWQWKVQVTQSFHTSKDTSSQCHIELNAKIEALLAKKGQRFTRDEWLQQYPRATEWIFRTNFFVLQFVLLLVWKKPPTNSYPPPLLRQLYTQWASNYKLKETTLPSEHLRLSFVNANLKAGNMNCIMAVGRISSL